MVPILQFVALGLVPGLVWSEALFPDRDELR
jgi:hypothetical protein